MLQQNIYCERCNNGVNKADYCIFFENIDTDQAYKGQDTRFFCVSCAFRLLSSREGREVKNYIPLNTIIPQKIPGSRKVNFNVEKEDLKLVELTLKHAFPAAGGKMGVMTESILVNIDILDESGMKFLANVIVERLSKTKEERGKFPVIE